jgi:hypothetical protein
MCLKSLAKKSDERARWPLLGFRYYGLSDRRSKQFFDRRSIEIYLIDLKRGMPMGHEQLALDRAVGEFVARHKVAARAHRLHEIRRFVREERGAWKRLNRPVDNL